MIARARGLASRRKLAFILSIVGVAVSALVIAEVLRELEAGPRSGGIDGSIRAVGHRKVLPGDQIHVGETRGVRMERAIPPVLRKLFRGEW